MKILLFLMIGIIELGAIENLRVVIDEIEYTCYCSGEEGAERQIKKIHSIFKNESLRIYEEWNIKRPNSFRVVLTENASVFGRLTGRNWQTASLYDADRDLFYFQSVHSLDKQGLLKQTVRHELCHQMLAVKRQKSADFWMEEGFCEAISNTQSGQGIEIIKNYPTLTGFKKFIQKMNRSKIKSEQNLGYRLSAEYALFLIRQLGKNSVLEYITQGDIPEKYYQEFYRDISSR